MTTHSRANRALLNLEELMLFGIGMTVGTLIALLLLVLVLADWTQRGDASLVSSLGPLLTRGLAGLREVLISEALLMGWPLSGESSAYWYMSRGAGFIGYLLLWAATAWGLIVSTKVAKGVIAAPFATSLHEFLSLGALAFSGFHALVLLGDGYIDFGLVDIIYPFAASYRPGWVGLGQLGFYLAAALTLSFYVRKNIGHKTWRSLHYLTFLTYALVLAHSLTTGTDVGAPLAQAMYFATGATLVFLIYYRLLASGHMRRPKSQCGLKPEG
jgi:predicted ferric reductase